MKPKTKLQIKVALLSGKLSPITEKQKSWAFEKCLDKYFARVRHTLYCLECGHTWKDIPAIVPINEYICPCCGNKLKFAEGYKRVASDSAYYAILTTKEDMQVIRMFYVDKYMKKRLKPRYFIDEVMQFWITPTGKNVVMSKNINGFFYCYDRWAFSSKLEIRPHSIQSHNRYRISPHKIHPKVKLIPIIKRNGFNGDFHEYSPQEFFQMLLSDSYTETLLKSGQEEMLKHRSEVRYMDNYWPSIKICIRNNYNIPDASMWIDYIDLLNYFRKDIRNPKIICPENLPLEHDKLVKRKIKERREQERREKEIRLEKLREKAIREQAKYIKKKREFLDLLFNDGNLIVKPLQSFEEFMMEGNELHHCVFENEYYKKDDSLILSARLDSKPVETIELSLKELKIVQCRGAYNQPTEYHDRIIKLVQNNIQHIAKRLKSKKESMAMAV